MVACQAAVHDDWQHTCNLLATHPVLPQMPDVLVRLGRPAGWQPPPPPTFSGVEVVSQGGSGQEASGALNDDGG